MIKAGKLTILKNAILSANFFRATNERQSSTLAEQSSSLSNENVTNELKNEMETFPLIEKRELWKVDKNNRFLQIPQAWVSTMSCISEKRVGLIDLHPDVFRTFPRLDVLHRNITWQNNYRCITFIKQLSKAEMPGGSCKPWPQKGTGRARHGGRRGPMWKGGGFAHGIRGPNTRFYMLPDSLRIKGICVALTIKHAQDDLVVIDDFESLPNDEPKFLEDLAAERNWGYSVLFINEGDVAPRNLAFATEELPTFNIMPYYGLNCLSMLKHDTLVISRKALDIVERRLLEHMHRIESLNKKFQYKDQKQKLMNESEHEDDEDMPPFV